MSEWINRQLIRLLSHLIRKCKHYYMDDVLIDKLGYTGDHFVRWCPVCGAVQVGYYDEAGAVGELDTLRLAGKWRGTSLE